MYTVRCIVIQVIRCEQKEPAAAAGRGRSGMQVEYGFVAEAADAQAGLFYVVRGGSDIWSVAHEVTFPLAIGPVSFLLRLVGDPPEVGRDLPLDFTIVDADGQPLGVQGSAFISFSPHPLDRTRTSGALLHFRLGFEVPAPGAYFFELHHKDERLTQIPFWVVAPANPS
jgi:hypothetical protein